MINGKEYELYDCPLIQGYDIIVKGGDNIQIKEEVGCGIHILYTIDSFLVESEMKIFNCTIHSIITTGPLYYVEYII